LILLFYFLKLSRVVVFQLVLLLILFSSYKYDIFSVYPDICVRVYLCVQDVRAWMSAQKWQRQRAKAKSQEQKQLIEWVASDTRVQRKINRFAIAL